MSGKKKTQTVEVQNRLDPASQNYVNQSRQMAGQGANAILGGPYGGGFAGGQPSYDPGLGYAKPQPEGRFGGHKNFLDQIRSGDANEPAAAPGGYAPSPGAGYTHTGGSTIMQGGPQIQPQAPGGSGNDFGPYGQNSFFSGPLADPSQLAEKFFNPYQQQVVNATQSDFDRLREGAQTGANQAATMNGAFRGSRHGVESAVRQGELDRAETSALANLRNSGFQNSMSQGVRFGQLQNQYKDRRLQEPMWRYQQALGLRNLGMGPTGGSQSQSNVQPGGSVLGGAASGALAGSAFGPLGAGIGGVVGGLGSLF